MNIQTVYERIGPLFAPHRLEAVGEEEGVFLLNLSFTVGTTVDKWAVVMPAGICVRQVVVLGRDFSFLIAVEPLFFNV